MQAPNRGGSSDREKELERKVESLEEQLGRAQEENERLRKQLEEALRANKRSAAPFSKGDPKPNPKPPGRKPGSAYGQRATRQVPSRVDEQIHVPLPSRCQHCQGPVILNSTQPQYQEDIVRVTIVRRFDVEVGTCACCGRQAQGRHPLQTSDSLRVGEVQVGPEALSMAAVLNKELGLSHERTARVLELGYGLKWSRSGVCRALERLGNLAAPTYQQLKSALRQSPVVWMDDTGWRVDGRPQNLRVLLSEQVTVYVIEPHRGYAEAAAILGKDYAGFLVHDGARCFYGFKQAFHQSCLEHLIRRCREMGLIASAAAAHLPMAVPRATAPVHLSALSWFGCHQQLRRAGDPTDGDGSQDLGRQSYGQRRPHAADSGQRFTHLLAAGQRRLWPVRKPTALCSSNLAGDHPRRTLTLSCPINKSTLRPCKSSHRFKSIKRNHLR